MSVLLLSSLTLASSASANGRYRVPNADGSGRARLTRRTMQSLTNQELRITSQGRLFRRGSPGPDGSERVSTISSYRYGENQSGTARVTATLRRSESANIPVISDVSVRFRTRNEPTDGFADTPREYVSRSVKNQFIARTMDEIGLRSGNVAVMVSRPFAPPGQGEFRNQMTAYIRSHPEQPLSHVTGELTIRRNTTENRTESVSLSLGRHGDLPQTVRDGLILTMAETAARQHGVRYVELPGGLRFDANQGKPIRRVGDREVAIDYAGQRNALRSSTGTVLRYSENQQIPPGMHRLALTEGEGTMAMVEQTTRFVQLAEPIQRQGRPDDLRTDFIAEVSFDLTSGRQQGSFVGELTNPQRLRLVHATALSLRRAGAGEGMTIARDGQTGLLSIAMRGPRDQYISLPAKSEMVAGRLRVTLGATDGGASPALRSIALTTLARAEGIRAGVDRVETISGLEVRTFNVARGNYED